MEIKSLLNSLQLFSAKNAPVILTGIAVSGVITTAIFAARGAAMALDEIVTAEDRAVRFGTPLPSQREQFANTWYYYAPAVTSGIVTIAAIILAQRVNMRRQAALAAAFTLSEKTLMDYREKLVSVLGARSEQKVIDGIAKDQIDRTPLTPENIIATGYGDTLCIEQLTGRYFKSDIERIRKIENEFNRLVVNNYYASLNDLYDLLGLPSSDLGAELGWNSMSGLLNISFSSHLTNTGVPCLSIIYNAQPKPKYYKVNP